MQTRLESVGLLRRVRFEIVFLCFPFGECCLIAGYVNAYRCHVDQKICWWHVAAIHEDDVMINEGKNKQNYFKFRRTANENSVGALSSTPAREPFEFTTLLLVHSGARVALTQLSAHKGNTENPFKETFKKDPRNKEQGQRKKEEHTNDH